MNSMQIQTNLSYDSNTFVVNQPLNITNKSQVELAFKIKSNHKNLLTMHVNHGFLKPFSNIQIPIKIVQNVDASTVIKLEINWCQATLQMKQKNDSKMATISKDKIFKKTFTIIRLVQGRVQQPKKPFSQSTSGLYQSIYQQQKAYVQSQKHYQKPQKVQKVYPKVQKVDQIVYQKANDKINQKGNQIGHYKTNSKVNQQANQKPYQKPYQKSYQKSYQKASQKVYQKQRPYQKGEIQQISKQKSPLCSFEQNLFQSFHAQPQSNLTQTIAIVQSPSKKLQIVSQEDQDDHQKLLEVVKNKQLQQIRKLDQIRVKTRKINHQLQSHQIIDKKVLILLVASTFFIANLLQTLVF